MKHPPCPLCFTAHASRRCAQRAVAPSTVEIVLSHGLPIRQAHGRVAWFLGRRQARRAGLPPQLAGTAAITARDGSVITVIRTKSTRRLRSGRGQRRRRPLR